MNDKPVWLLDIDGVINAVLGRSRKVPSNIWPAEDWIQTSVQSDFSTLPWPFTVSASVVAGISEIHEEGLAEIRWHTTWQDRANYVSDAVGLPYFPIQESPEFFEWWNSDASNPDPTVGWWKLPAVWRVVESGRKVVWTDDDINIYLSIGQHARLRHAGCQTFVPDTNSGLTKRHLADIRETLEAWRPAMEERPATEEVVA